MFIRQFFSLKHAKMCLCFLTEIVKLVKMHYLKNFRKLGPQLWTIIVDALVGYMK